MKSIKILFLAIILFSFINIYSQPYNPYEGIGGMNDQEPTIISYDKNSVTPGGRYKPERTNLYQGTNDQSVFRILIVFVQFANDYTYDWCTYWPPQQAPDYMNTLLAPNRHNYHVDDWWNEYGETNETLSDYFMEMSRGKFHVVGQCVNVILPHDSSYYQRTENQIFQLNTDLYNELTSQVDWQQFDKWDYDNNTFVYQRDYNIDMIYVVHRIWRDNIFQGLLGSIAQLYNSTQGQSHNLGNGYYIKAGCYTDGSGVTFTTGQGAKVPYAPFKKNKFLTIQAHELGHYLFGYGHQSYGLMMGGWINGLIATGVDSRTSPWETIYLGYGTPTVVDFSDQINYHLNDFSSRDGSSTIQVLQVPLIVNNPDDEFFLLANRSKVSSYDRIMWGDTAKNDCFRNINTEYGKGIYIYHKKYGYTWDEYEPYRYIDQECADGLFEWEFSEYFYPDWSNSQQLAFLKKTNVCRDNDHSFGSYYCTDEKSVLVNYDQKSWNYWGSKGKKHTCLDPQPCNESTDRIYTNDEEIWTSRAWEGDRWDAWREGYNEVFSPYSSPSTCDWSSNNTGIFIWLHNLDANGADFKIYRTGYGGYNLSSILNATPPSRPMGISTDYHFVSETLCHPKITWVNNTEPDVINPNNGKIRYKLYRAYKLYMNQIPGPPVLIENYLEFDPNETPTYIDYQIIGYLSTLSGEEPWLYPVRYWVKVVDNSYDESAFSDFTSAIGINDGSVPIGGSGSDNLISNSKIPKSFDLKQNYPNPFNPVTNIKYDLPKDIFVTVKIYDLLGREIKTLVNEFKNAGSYLVSFNGSEFASGVYFYRIQAGNFIQVKKMVLIK